MNSRLARATFVCGGGRILAEAMRTDWSTSYCRERGRRIGHHRRRPRRPGRTDRYTFVIGNLATHVLNGAMFMLQYDPQKYFEPISLVSSNPLIIVAKKAVPANDLVIGRLKANPNQALQGYCRGLSLEVGNPSNVARAMWRCSCQ